MNKLGMRELGLRGPITKAEGEIRAAYHKSIAARKEAMVDETTGTEQAAQHTPGPWRVEEDVYGCKSIFGNVKDGDGGLFTCTEIGYTHGLENETEDAANARLIAAAPTMYAYILGRADGGDSEAERVVSLINA